jgi:hypothetical protein
MKKQIIMIVVAFSFGTVVGGGAVFSCKQKEIDALLTRSKAAQTKGPKKSWMDSLEFSDKPVHW